MLWEAHQLSKKYRVRASELYGVTDELTAWSFDRAVATFAGALENRLHEVSEDSKNRKTAQAKVKRELQKWLSSADTKAAKGVYRDPMLEMR